MADKTRRTVVPRAEDAAGRRRGRSWAIMIVLAGLAALFYAITIVKHL
jgi:hypothetical protein